MTAKCNCKYKDMSQSNLEPLIDDLFGDAFEFIDSSNIEVLKCHKNFFKYFTKSIGGIILLILIIADITFSVLFFTFELFKLKKYVLTLTDNYLSYLKEAKKDGGKSFIYHIFGTFVIMYMDLEFAKVILNKDSWKKDCKSLKDEYLRFKDKKDDEIFESFKENELIKCYDSIIEIKDESDEDYDFCCRLTA